jgi:hypothetical protein
MAASCPAGATAAADPLAGLRACYAEVDARAGAPYPALRLRHTEAALRAYVRVCGEHPASEPDAREALASLVPEVLRDATELRTQARDDPAAPGLPEACAAVLNELDELAAATVPAPTAGPADAYAAVYAAVCEETIALMAAMEAAEAVWAWLFWSFAASRAAPPGAPVFVRPRDDGEYYGAARPAGTAGEQGLGHVAPKRVQRHHTPQPPGPHGGSSEAQ